jgi:hypothetical protein
VPCLRQSGEFRFDCANDFHRFRMIHKRQDTLRAPSRYCVKPAKLTRCLPKFEPPNIAGTHNPRYPAALSTKVPCCGEFNICGTQLSYRASYGGECANRNDGRYNPAPIPDKTVGYEQR